MKVELPLGDVVDRASILAIKKEKVADSAKQAHIRRELEILVETWEAQHPPMATLSQWNELCAVNRELWEVEDALRDCESRQDFGESFVTLARSVYRLNDRRAELKGDINGALHSSLVEVKWYGNLQSDSKK